MRQHVIALVDCDCFFVSCERKDNPDLQGKPVCVMTGASSKGKSASLENTKQGDIISFSVDLFKNKM